MYDYDWVLNTPIEGFAHNPPWRELAIAPVQSVQHQQICNSITNKLAVSSVTDDTLLENQYFIDVSLIENYVYAAHCSFRWAF